MKKAINLLIAIFTVIIMFAGCSNSNTEAKKKASDFKIYLVNEKEFSKLIDTKLEDIPLDGEPLITEKDIKAYYWKGQSEKVSSLFELRDSKILLERMMDRGYTGLNYYPFITVVGEKRMYLGALYSPFTSVSPPQGIHIFIGTIALNSKAYEIYETDSKELIHDKQIYKALEKEGILKMQSMQSDDLNR